MKNRLPRKTKKKKTVQAPVIDLRAQQIICKKLAESMREAAVEFGMQVSGQAAIEKVAGDKGLIVVYSCFPNGDIVVWFLSQGYYSLMALVNKNFKHLATFPADKFELFQIELSKLQLALGK